MAILLSGCRAGENSGNSDSGHPDVSAIIGRTGPGPGEFIYPRPIALAADGSLWVADKTGRLQHLDGCPPAGRWLATITMPQFEDGKPTGLAVGPDGNIYVADTHYHRVIVFTPAGQVVREFGRLGRGDGEFIYPTAVAFAGERILVSEYGGNDRVSVFTGDGRFLYSFGQTVPAGGGEAAPVNDLDRPNAMAVDHARRRLYVADACHHRIVVFDLSADPYRQVAAFGSPGRQVGQLRYPYGLALAGEATGEGTVVVCEFGNNRLQMFSPDGRSRGVLGGPGRDSGQLAFPWGVAVRGSQVYVSDAGNNRVQAWRLDEKKQ